MWSLTGKEEKLLIITEQVFKKNQNRLLNNLQALSELRGNTQMDASKPNYVELVQFPALIE